MYVKKEIREFIEKMPKKEKLTREWKKFIQESTIKHNLLIEHGKEEYECTHCGKYSYGKLLSDRNYKYHDICRFCGKKYEIRRSNLKNYFFLYNVAIVDNINNKLVMRYFQVYRYYNNRIRRFTNSIAEFARYVPEYDITLLNNRCPKGINIYHDEEIKKWRVFAGEYYKHKGYDAIYLRDIDEKKKGTIYQYIPLGDAINHLEDVTQNNFSIQLYLDYIDNLMKIGIPLTKKKLLPANFSEAHDISMKKVKIAENKLLDEKIKQRYEELKRNNYKDNKFCIRPAKTLNDMKDESNQQNNCVYSNYSEKYANGITDIYFLRKLKNPDKSLVTVEVLDGKVRQKYEKRNTAINKEEKEFLNLWEKNILNVA